jgi:hypothetical protein
MCVDFVMCKVSHALAKAVLVLERRQNIDTHGSVGRSGLVDEKENGKAKILIRSRS